MKRSSDSYLQDTEDGLGPVHGDEPEVLILGSFPSKKSLASGMYYGNPQNQFWKIMEQLFSIDTRLPYSVRIAGITGCHLALWDVVRCCSRQGSADSRIANPGMNDLPLFIRSHPSIRLVALNGTTAARLYRRSFPDLLLQSIVLPSTSPANTRMSLLEKVACWETVKQCRRPVTVASKSSAPSGTSGR